MRWPGRVVRANVPWWLNPLGATHDWRPTHVTFVLALANMSFAWRLFLKMCPFFSCLYIFKTNRFSLAFKHSISLWSCFHCCHCWENDSFSQLKKMHGTKKWGNGLHKKIRTAVILLTIKYIVKLLTQQMTQYILSEPLTCLQHVFSQYVFLLLLLRLSHKQIQYL